MKQPTTRRGRFLYYKRRYRNRQLQIKNRRRRPGAKSHKETCYERDTSAIPYQAAKRPRKLGNGPIYPLGFTQLVYIKSEGRKRPPLVYMVPGVFLSDKAIRLHRVYVGWMQRRVKKIPRLKHLPVMPFVGTTPPAKPWWDPSLVS